MTANVHLFAIGSELLLPGREDTNTVYLRRRLRELGLRVDGILVVGDDENALIQFLDTASRRSRIVLTTGGLGPTEDDVTRKALNRFLKKTPRYDEAVRAHIEAFFAARKMKMPESCLKEALVPTGCRVLMNDVGTAPGIWLEERGCLFVLLPGPPREMSAMFEGKVVPLLAEKFGCRKLFQKRLKLVGIGESLADQAASPVYRQYKDVETIILSRPGEIELIFTLTGEGASPDTLDKLVKEVQAGPLRPHVFSTEGKTMEEVVGDLLKARKLTLGVAESCTGGLLSKRLTDLPGSSAFFVGGAVCYDNRLKTHLADVPPELLEARGAVSSGVAAAMAAGIRRKTVSDASIGITGVAGPGGGTPDKPVGTVYIAVCLGDKSLVKKYLFPGDRERVRAQAAQTALDLLRRLLTGEDIPISDTSPTLRIGSKGDALPPLGSKAER
ncbi:MAG: competence/damage-inducible protein A [Acidobacteria bacterium]|nr:competence/damage-inducible protein A [Acidobacteriota bacterium]